MNNINISESRFLENFSEKALQTDNDNSFNSIFDVHANGVVDEGDFTQKDLSNSDVKTFLSEFLNKNWTKKIENKIADVLNILNKENFEKDCGKYKIKLKNDKFVIKTQDKETEVRLIKDSSVTKEYLQKLIDVLSSLTDEEMEDFISEVNGIKLTDQLVEGERGTVECDHEDLLILDTKQNAQGIDKNTIVHELGHAISRIHKNNKGNYINYSNYSYEDDLNKRFKDVSNICFVLEKFADEFGGNPCLKDKEILFNEYSLYKQGFPTEHNSEALFEQMERSDDKEVKKMLEILKDPVQMCMNMGIYDASLLTDEDIAMFPEESAFDEVCNNYYRSTSGTKYLFQKLREKYGQAGEPSDELGDKYCIKDENEFFAEYYLYKMEGATHHGSEKLFAELAKSEDKDIQDLLKIMESHIKISEQDEKFRKVH